MQYGFCIPGDMIKKNLNANFYFLCFQFIVLIIALVSSVRGSPQNSKSAYGYQGGVSYGTNGHHEQHSSTNAFNSESEYQQGQYGGHLNSGSGHQGSGGGHLSSGSSFTGSSSGPIGGGIGHMGNGGLGNSGFGHGIHHGHGYHNQGGFGQGGLSQGGFGQGGFGQGGFGQGGLNQGGFGQGGLSHGSSQHQQNFRSAGEIDGSSINIAPNFPKNNDEAIVFGNQPISGDWSSIQPQAGISEIGPSGGIRDETPLLTSTTWGAMPNRNYRKISSSVILPISYSNEQESRNVSEHQTSQNGSTTDQLRN